MPRPIRSPFQIPYGAQYGAPRAGGRHHQGTDYHCPVGTPIYGTRSGGRVVSNVGESGYGIGFGNYVSILYAGGYMTLDGHLHERSPLATGSFVDERTVVGAVGLSGNSVYADPPGAHNHHQLWVNGVLVDPESYYALETADSGSTLIPEDDMPLNDTDKDWIRQAVRQEISSVTSATGDIQARMMSATGGGWDSFDELVRNTRAIKAAQDPAALSKAISDKVIASLPSGADAAAIAAAVDAVLADNFAAIPDSTLNAQAERLKS